jgi:hypothetical protein
MKTLLILASLLVPLGMAACADDGEGTYHNAVTGAICSPDHTFVPRSAHHERHPGCDDRGCCQDVKGCDGGHGWDPDAAPPIENPP